MLCDNCAFARDADLMPEMFSPTAGVPLGCVHDDALPWLPLHPALPGVVIKYLSIDADADVLICLLRMPAGMTLPRHRHEGPVLVYTLQGAWRYQEYDWVARAGSVVHEPAGSCHTPQTLATGDGAAVTFNIMHGDLVLLDDEMVEIARENCRVARMRQRRFERNAARVSR